MVVTIVIVINSVIGGFSWVDLAWLASSNFRLQVSDNNQLQLSNYNCTEWLMKYKAADAPITFEQIVMVMIKAEIRTCEKLSATISLEWLTGFSRRAPLLNQRLR